MQNLTSNLQLVSHTVRRFPRITNTGAGLAAGSVFSFGLPVWFLPFFLIVFIRSFSDRLQRAKLRRDLSLALCFFIPFHAVVLSWFLDTNISGLIGMSRPMALFAAILSWLIMTIITTLPMLALALVVRRYSRPQNHVVSGGVIGAAWLVCEWARSMLFSLFLYGSQGSIGDYWNFGSLGLALMDTPFSYLSRFVGMYGLSFLMVFVTVVLYKSRQQKNYIIFGVITALIVSLTAVSYQGYTSNLASEQKNGSVLQNKDTLPSFGYGTITDSQSNNPKDLIVLPEYSHMFDREYAEFADLYVNNRLAESGVSINVSDGDGSKWYGTLEFRDSHGKKISTQTKELLIPTGEYLPYVLSVFYRLTGQQKIIDQFSLSRQVHKGEPPKVFVHGDLVVGPVACSGILGRNIYRGLTADGAEVLTNSASLIDFQNSKAYFRQSIQMARFHAVANNRPFIQSSLGAAAFVLDHQGDYIVKPGDASTKFIDFSFVLQNKITPYTHIGEWVLIASALFLPMYAIAVRKNKSSQNY